MFNNILKNVGALKRIKEATSSGLVLNVQGATTGEKALSIFASKAPCAVVVSGILQMQELKENLECLGLKVLQLSADLTPPIFTPIKDQSLKIDMLTNLYKFLLGEADVLLISEEVLFYKFPKKISKEDGISMRVNSEYNFLELTQKLINYGYKKCQKPEKIGDFSIKGDILDIFLPNFDNLIRLDFFGDMLEKISLFDSEEMQKIEEYENINIFPCVLYNLDEEEKLDVLKNLKNELKFLSSNGEAVIKSNLIVSQVEEGLNEKLFASDIEYLRPFIENYCSVIDIVKQHAIVVVDEPKKMSDSLKEIAKELYADVYDYIETGELLPLHAKYIFDEDQVLRFDANLIFSSVDQKVLNYNVKETIRTIGSRKYTFDYKALINDLFIYERSKYKVVLFAGSVDSKNSVSEYLVNHGIFVTEDINMLSNKFQVCVLEQKFYKSCSFLDSGLIVIGTDDLIKKTRADVKNITGKNKKRKVFYLPKVGDFVVHETHGIGKCIALEKLNFNGTEKDYFIIEYLGGDKLYLPSEQADLISAYMGADAPTKLNKIGGEQFAKIKQKVKESVSKLAINLVEIYAKREKSKGHVYSDGGALYEEFENAFLYTETEDQLSAIADIKKDMESPKIMDRLICGDVGYGKTEVALRAIYRAVLDGKQVALLCPTTILSQQHYKTAIERFKDFMVRVQVLNRFKTKAQQEQILKDLKDGKIDLIIGTHRLLSGDVNFKNLGMLVLDEEQRFGVADKEKIKLLKENVDVLTLSATPIPRTLNMALTGVRDISIIETPPKERIAVKTYVQEESDTLILNACKKELARGGQVLFVYNRVESIMEQASRVRALLPEARVGVAHGQMPEKMLEDTILKLYNGEYDIMVATTLIESGIDLPLANTLIVIDADRLGLSELYQLRGRIGRSDKVAYAYFTYNPAKLLTADAYKRLDAILEFTELGSGFKIAMRDLEIRGAGDILGKEQHGHLEKVGYDMYCKLLESAVKELKGEKVKETKPIKIDIFASANLPKNYIEKEEDRIKLYSEISTIARDDQREEMLNKLAESFKSPPIEAQRLLKIAQIKNLASEQEVKRVLIDANKCCLYLYKMPEILTKGLNFALSKSNCGALKFEDVPIINFEMGMCSIDEKIDFVLNFLNMAIKIENWLQFLIYYCIILPLNYVAMA